LEYFSYIKSLHIIFVITWFAGLFYIPRLFIYYIEASEKSNPEKKNIDRSIYNNDESFVVYNNVAILNIGNFIWFLDGYFSAKLVV
jgi:putative membrane protein